MYDSAEKAYKLAEKEFRARYERGEEFTFEDITHFLKFATMQWVFAPVVESKGRAKLFNRIAKRLYARYPEWESARPTHYTFVCDGVYNNYSFWN